MAKILLVEDNELSQKMMFYTLKRINLQADVASDGEEAVDMAAQEDYDIILMDIQLPVCDGYEATRRIREAEAASGKRACVIGLSANFYDQERDKCIEMGMDDYLPKPFDVQRFIDVLEERGFTIPNT